MADSKRKLVGTIDVTPNYPVLIETFGIQLSEHGFTKNMLAPVISLIEMVRYIDRKDNHALPPSEQVIEGILNRLRAKNDLSRKAS